MKNLILILSLLLSFNSAFAAINPGGPTGPNSSNLEEDEMITTDNVPTFDEKLILTNEDSSSNNEVISIDENAPDLTQTELDEDFNKTQTDVLNVKNTISKAKFFLKRGDNEKALLEVEKVLEVEPENIEALEIKTEIEGETEVIPESVTNNVVDTENVDLPLDENSGITPEDVETDHKNFIEENMMILLVSVGSLILIIMIFVFSRIGKSKNKQEQTNNNTQTTSSKNPASNEEDPFDDALDNI